MLSKHYLRVRGQHKGNRPVSVIDDARQPIDLTGRNLKFCLATKSGVPLFEYAPDISGSSFSVDNLDASVRSVKRDFLWSLRDADDGDEPVTFGDFHVILQQKEYKPWPQAHC